jgi:hypothetical protein
MRLDWCLNPDGYARCILDYVAKEAGALSLEDG